MYTSLVLPALLLSIVPFTTPSALPASYDERAPAPKAVKSNLKRLTTASIVEIDFEELAGGRLLAEVEIGGQGLTMMVDTGSGDLWVYGPEVEHPGKRKIYTPSKRPITGETFLVRYGVDGKETSEGIVANDTLDIGSVSISDVPVGVATEVNTNLPADGLLGMGHFNNIGPQKLPSFADVMMSSLEAPVFTLDLQDTDHAQMTLGWIDHSRYTGELTTVPAITGFAGWVVANVSFAVNGVPMVFTQEEMALDSAGGVVMRVDPGIAQEYYSGVLGARRSTGMSWEGYRWIIPCATKPPDLTVMIAGAKALIPGYSLMTYILAHRGGVWCQGGVQATEGHNHGNLANYFFMSQFVAFNVAEKTISFAPYAS